MRWGGAKVKEETMCSAPVLSRADNHDFQFQLGAVVYIVAASLLLSLELAPALPPVPTTCSYLGSSASYGCSGPAWAPQALKRLLQTPPRVPRPYSVRLPPYQQRIRVYCLHLKGNPIRTMLIQQPQTKPQPQKHHPQLKTKQRQTR